MKLTILGANGPFPAAGGACSGYLLSSDSGQTNIMLDCGSGTLSRLLEELSLEYLDAVVLSHLHYDHMSDILPMQYALQFSSRIKSLPVIVPFQPKTTLALLNNPVFDLSYVQDRKIGEMSLSFLPAVHPIEAYSICVECDGVKFVYTGDTNENPALELFADGADLLLADAGLMSVDWSARAPHLSAEMCGKLAKSVQARQLLLTHLNPNYNLNELLEEACRYYPNAECAVQGDSHYV